ncbi:MAG TPA: 2-oxoacid:acceptor oxidoreductase subunit alpha [Anaerolineaceae bacterium]|nr:2-oxoacid:acceptor oxidoreductase subunit alpha [Anaerolineaceae bacterium]
MQIKRPRVMSGTHFMLGNFAAVEGALAAGCNFFAGYPITPANEVSERMAERMPEVGGKFLQGEDELCSIYALAGAALAGAKVMTATASAGFDYMAEGIEYAISDEIPMVIMDVQRTRGENFATQADVMQMRWGAAGDHEIIVLAPSSVQELFDYTIRAFNLAEKYRNPVIIMSETTISLMRERLIIPPADQIEIINRKMTMAKPVNYAPFRAEMGEVPEMAPLGKGYNVLYSINPHNENGSIKWEPEIFERQYQRITQKILMNLDDIVTTDEYQTGDAELILIAYGSESRPCKDAVDIARNQGKKVGLLKLNTVWPVPEKQILAATRKANKILAVEMNMGKYAGEIERIAGCHSEVIRVTKNLGAIHTSGEIFAAIEEALR